jgi:hypothetical protein
MSNTVQGGARAGAQVMSSVRLPAGAPLTSDTIGTVKTMCPKAVDVLWASPFTWTAMVSPPTGPAGPAPAGPASTAGLRTSPATAPIRPSALTTPRPIPHSDHTAAGGGHRHH